MTKEQLVAVRTLLLLVLPNVINTGGSALSTFFDTYDAVMRAIDKAPDVK